MTTGSYPDPPRRSGILIGSSDYPAGDVRAESHSHGLMEASREVGVLRIDIHGSWSVADLIKLLGRVEDGYKAAAALEALTDQSSLEPPPHSDLSADALLQVVTAFQLGGGLRLGSVQYGSPGFLTFIGLLTPLKTITGTITANRDINRKRDEARRLDEREREHDAMSHEEAMTRESRLSEQQRLDYAARMTKLQVEAERGRLEAANALVGQLPRAQQSSAAAEILRFLMRNSEEIANDGRIDGARMLDRADVSTASDPASDATDADDGDDDVIPSPRHGRD